MVPKHAKTDTRFKTEDVTATKGMAFKDFGLQQNLLLVRKIELKIRVGHL